MEKGESSVISDPQYGQTMGRWQLEVRYKPCGTTQPGIRHVAPKRIFSRSMGVHMCPPDRSAGCPRRGTEMWCGAPVAAEWDARRKNNYRGIREPHAFMIFIHPPDS